jgi:hypothetical protein
MKGSDEMITTSLPGRFTLGDLARLLRLPPYRVTYLIRSRGIVPIERVAHVGLYDKQALDTLTSAVTEIESKRHRPVAVSA